MERDHELAALSERYLARLRALVAEWEAEQERVWREYEEAAA